VTASDNSADAVFQVSVLAGAKPMPSFHRRELDLVERLVPDGVEVVADVAGRTSDEHVRAPEHLGRDGGKRGLADTPLAVDDGVLTGLLDDREQLGDLLAPSGEETAAIDRRCGAEDLADQPQSFLDVGLGKGGTGHGWTMPRPGSRHNGLLRRIVRGVSCSTPPGTGLGNNGRHAGLRQSRLRAAGRDRARGCG
jgi:hypothetical protein